MRTGSFKRLVVGLTSLALAAAIWLPSVHWFFRRGPERFRSGSSVSEVARQLANRHVELWTDPALRRYELERMRASNAEWDFMGRSFLVWSLANLGLREPAAKQTYLAVIDQIIDETARLEHERGLYFFLMPYAKARPYEVQPARSLFLDGEIALMLAARRVVEEKPEYKAAMTERIKGIVDRMENNPVPFAESYPNECWMFDHVNALAAIKIADFLDRTDHSALLQSWLALAKRKLVHRETGLLISSFTLKGEPLDGPEGSTIWMVAHGPIPESPQGTRTNPARLRLCARVADLMEGADGH